MDLRTDDFDFDLPRKLIAQQPLARRVDSRMMIVDRATELIEHVHVRDLPDWLTAGDLSCFEQFESRCCSAIGSTERYARAMGRLVPSRR